MSGVAVEDINPITVKIKLDENIENAIAVNFPQNFNIGNLKEDISKKFSVSPESLLVYQENETICNEHLLSDLLLNDFGIVEIKLKLTDEVASAGGKLDINVYYSSFTLPDIITVHIPSTNEDGESVVKDLVVEIENKAIKKPFLGGFVHKKTKIEYHHAETQTGPTVEQIDKLKEYKCTRDTQTAQTQRIAIDTTKDQSTQYFGDANEPLYQTLKNDSEVEPNAFYETFEQREKRLNILDKVKLIQRNFRRVRLNQCVKVCAAEYRRLQAIKKKQEERLKQDYINSNRKSENFPRTKKDFDVLFAQIAAWKEAETRKIQENFTGPTRIVELQALLEKEIQLLNGIESRKIEIKSDLQIEREDTVLSKVSEPIKWLGYNNKIIEMDTLKTQRARKLSELFTLLREPFKNLDDRLRLLNDISKALSNENAPRINELEALFDRERELLKCKVSNNGLELLRRRQLNIFLDIIKNEDRNKCARRNCQICEKCKSIIPISNSCKRSNLSDICKKCAKLRTSKTDLSIYKAILRTIIRDERKRSSFSSIAFIIQETDIKHIIENIWHGISILSQSNCNLRLPRWNVNEEWSPWNCICLTDTESKVHVQCADLTEIYGEKIISECRSKHSLAKSIYGHLKKIEKDPVSEMLLNNKMCNITVTKY